MFTVALKPICLVSAFGLMSAVATATEVRRSDDALSFQAHRGTVEQIAITAANPQVFATSSGDGEVAVWDRTTLSPYWKATIADFSTGLEFSSTGRLLAAGGQCQLMLLDIDDGYPVSSFTVRKPGRTTGCNINWDEPDQIVFSHDDSSIFSGYTDAIFHFDVTNGQLVHMYGDMFNEGYQFWGLQDFLLSSDETYLYALDERQFRAYLVSTGELVRNFELNAVAGLDGVDISRAGLTAEGLYSVIADGLYVYVVDNTHQRVVRRILASADRITSAGFTEDLCCIMLSSADGTTRTYEIATGQELLRLDDTRPPRDRSWQTAVAAQAGSTEAITGDGGGKIWLWKTAP